MAALGRDAATGTRSPALAGRRSCGAATRAERRHFCRRGPDQHGLADKNVGAPPSAGDKELPGSRPNRQTKNVRPLAFGRFCARDGRTTGVAAARQSAAIWFAGRMAASLPRRRYGMARGPPGRFGRGRGEWLSRGDATGNGSAQSGPEARAPGAAGAPLARHDGSALAAP